MPLEDYPLISSVVESRKTGKRSIRYPQHYKGWRILRPDQIEYTQLHRLASPTGWVPMVYNPCVVGLFDRNFSSSVPQHLRDYELWHMQYYPTASYRVKTKEFRACAIWCSTEHKMNVIRWMDAAGAIAYYKHIGRTRLPNEAKHNGDPLIDAIAKHNREKLLALCEQTGYADLEQTGQSAPVSIRVSGTGKKPNIAFE